MPIEWVLSVMLPIFKGKSDIRNYSCYRAVKVVKRLHRIVTDNEILFGLLAHVSQAVWSS